MMKEQEKEIRTTAFSRRFDALQDRARAMMRDVTREHEFLQDTEARIIGAIEYLKAGNVDMAIGMLEGALDARTANRGYGE